jgi:putative GTP pyrophosphokinase
MEAGASASKRKINECGALLRDLPPGIDEAITIVETWRSDHAAPLARVAETMQKHTPEVAQRIKRFDAILNKLRRHPRMNLSQMEDVAGVRATFATQQQVLHVAAALEAAPPGRLRRKRMYIDGADPGPKPDGYRAVHLVIDDGGRFVEIQLRTRRQDAWAQMVERDTRRLGEALKFGGGPEDLRDFYRTVSEEFAMFDAAIEPTQAFTDALAQRYAATRRHFRR